jgi:hypothetical protein
MNLDEKRSGGGPKATAGRAGQRQSGPDVEGPRDQALEGEAAAGRALPKEKMGFPALLEHPLKIGLLGPT